MAIYGDTSGTLSGHQKGKGQRLLGDGSIIGDAWAIQDDAKGGNDQLIGTGDRNFLYGDALIMGGHSVGGKDVLTGAASASMNYLVGDGVYMSGFAVGGNDRLTGGDYATNQILGDGMLSESAMGGDDTLRGGDYAVHNYLVGDGALEGTAAGGSDTVRGGDHADLNLLFGDADDMADSTIGGNDTLEGGSFAKRNILNGDGKLLEHAHGGDDDLTGGDYAAENYLYGDGNCLGNTSSDSAVGGDDTLRGGDYAGANYLYGDGELTDGNAVCGNDRLVSGTEAPDKMWGDGVQFSENTVRGADTFVFAPMNGQDTIFDFEQGRDHIELTGFKHLKLFSDLDVHSDGSGGSIIDFHDGNTITVLGVVSLTASDFII